MRYVIASVLNQVLCRVKMHAMRPPITVVDYARGRAASVPVEFAFTTAFSAICKELLERRRVPTYHSCQYDRGNRWMAHGGVGSVIVYWLA